MSRIFSTTKLATVCLVTTLFSFAPQGVSAQKFAYIDSDYVLLHMPDYATAQQELNTYAIEWQAEIEAKLEQEIIKKRAEAKEMQKQKFGVDGELFLKRQELIEPIQQQIFEELKDIAGGSGYMVVFDKSNQSNMLYTNPKYDISDRLIKKLGYVPGETIEVEKDDKGDGGLIGRGQDALNNARDNVRDAGRSTMERERGGTSGSKPPKQ